MLIKDILLEKNKLNSLISPGKTKAYLMLLLCLVGVSCIKQKNLYQGETC